MAKCVICDAVLEDEENSAILCVNGNGNSCLVCSDCEEKFNTVVESDDENAVLEAIKFIADNVNESDMIIVDAVNEIFSESKFYGKK